MKKIPTFEFRQATAPQAAKQKAFVELLAGTKRIWRNEKSQIMFEVWPGDFCLVERKQGLRSILEGGEVIEIIGDVDDNCFDILWIWVTAGKWRLPRMNPEKPWQDPRPVFVNRAKDAAR